MIGTQITLNNPNGASHYQAQQSALDHMYTQYVKTKKMRIQITDDGGNRTIEYKFADEEARAEFEADPIIIAMMEASRQHNTAAGIQPESTELVV